MDRRTCLVDESRAREAQRGLAGRVISWSVDDMTSRYPEQEAAVRGRYKAIEATLDERGRRLFVATEALQIGFGGLATVERATGLARSTIRRGIAELGDLERLAPPPGKQRRAGGGRPRLTEKDPGLLPALRTLVDSATRGDPESPLLWLSKSGPVLTSALKAAGHVVSVSTTRRLLKKELGFTLQKTKKSLDGSSHKDRNAQFEQINGSAKRFQKLGQPVISVDTKKKELIGEYQNVGREWQAKGKPALVLTHDFPNGKPKAVPYGVYDLTRNEGWVGVGVSSDTAEFAVATISRWWAEMGSAVYPDATDLMITADCGGSNGYRLRLWKLMLQKFADETGLTVTVAHLPPGTSKWNKVEHKMFSFISMNWRGRPLVSYETVVQLIGATTTSKGLTIRCELDEGDYLKGRKVSDAELDAINIEKDRFHGEWNYTVYADGQGS
jgi:hypothetical protein